MCSAACCATTESCHICEKKQQLFFNYFHFPCKINASSVYFVRDLRLPYVCHTPDDTDPARYLSLNSPDSLILFLQQIPHASQRCAPWGIFFYRLKIISCVFPILVYSSLVRAIRPPNKDFLLCVQIALEARSKVVSRTGFSFAPVRF